MSEHAISNAKAWLENIREMVTDLNLAESGGDEEAREACRNRIEEAPLSVMVRDGWHSPGQAHDRVGEPQEYEILLSTGGPALRIYGGFDEYNQPDDDPRLQWQDWGTPWTDYPLGEARDDVATFARQFYFDEG